LQATDNRARLFASVMTMNLLWAVWMIFVERVVVGMAWSAVADLRLSALFWNTLAAIIWTGHIELGLSALQGNRLNRDEMPHWQDSCLRPGPPQWFQSGKLLTNPPFFA